MISLSQEKAVLQFVHFSKRAFEAAKQFKWFVGTFLVATPFVAIYGLLTTPIHLYTVLFNVFFAFWSVMGLTAGYHRLWSHRTYEAHWTVQVFLGILGSACFSMTIKQWVNDHRAHHKYTDTDQDPYDARKGLWWSHLGWLLWKRERPNSDVRDIENDAFLKFQHIAFVPLAFFFGWGVPYWVAGYGWGDWRGGFYLSIVRTVLVHHAIFCINSLAHWGGEAIYSDQLTARENPLLAIITNGEGYHNFHHEFPNDYRNGVNWHAYDPSKWFIYAMYCLGLAWDLKTTPEDQIQKAKIQTMLRIMEAQKTKYFWGKPIESLPEYTLDGVEMEVKEKKSALVVMDNVVYDVAPFVNIHPGGNILKAYYGKDIKKAFTGGVYQHTYSAKAILDTLRVGVIGKPASKCN